MAKVDVNSYEDVRKQRLLDNKQRFEELGLLKLSKSLSDVTKSEKKPQLRRFKPKPTNDFIMEPRRSSRARNPVSSYRDDWSSQVDAELPRLRKRSRFDSSWTSYLARPVEEIKSATYNERAKAYKSAEKLQSNLQSGNPSFVKSMVRSHVYSCFWLGLPTKFCVDHLPKSTVDMVLENENGVEYDAVFISKRTGLSGGWRAFALDHKLDDGDALVFELIEPTKFKVYIVRAFDCENREENVPVEEVEGETEETIKKVVNNKKKSDNKHSKNSTPVVEVEGEAEETAKKVTKNRKKSDNEQSKNSTESKSSHVSATRRSLRNK